MDQASLEQPEVKQSEVEQTTLLLPGAPQKPAHRNRYLPIGLTLAGILAVLVALVTLPLWIIY